MEELEDQGADDQVDESVETVDEESYLLPDDQDTETVDDQSSQGTEPEDSKPALSFDGNDYSEEQVRDLIEKNGQYDKLLPEYTRDHQELAQYRNSGGEQAQQGQRREPAQPKGEGQDLNQHFDTQNWHPEDRQAMQGLVGLVDNMIQAKVGPVKEGQQKVEEDHQISQMTVKYPGFSKDETVGVLSDQGISDMELGHLALLGKKYLAAQAKNPKDDARKKNARTVTGKGKAPGGAKKPLYNAKQHEGEEFDATVQMENIKETMGWNR